ncbi:MAG TPA: hypothetical protein VF542_16940 [Jatrophihabitans sp.]|jgi:hypothetical protein
MPVLARLAEVSRAGRPAHDLALLLFSAGLPSPPELVRAGVAGHLEAARDQVFAQLNGAPRIESGLALSSAYEAAEKFAAEQSAATVGRPSGSSEPSSRRSSVVEGDVESALIGVLAAAFGDPPDGSDREGVERLVDAGGARGLLVELAPGVGPVVADASEYVDAVKLTGEALLGPVPEMTTANLNAAYHALSTLTAALSLVPEQFRHHFGGMAVAAMWVPDDPGHGCAVAAMVSEHPHQRIGREHR